MKPKTTAKDAKLAAKWACDERTVRRWRKVGAPIADDKAMRTWLTGRKHIPPGTAALLEADRTAERAAGASERPKQAEGAANALRRLEQAETIAYEAFTKATASGDPVEIKSARENWLRISESLRRFDLAIEAARRESGDLVPRQHLEDLAYELQQANHFALFALETSVPSLTGLSTPGEVWAVLSKLREAVAGSVKAYLIRTRPEPIPTWLIRAVTLGSHPVNPAKVEQGLVDFWAALRALMQEAAANSRAELDQAFARNASKDLPAGHNGAAEPTQNQN